MTERLRLFDFASPAFTFVFTLGVVSLFADVTYEGGGSLNPGRTRGRADGAGGIVAGLLYERSLGLMVAFSSAAELSSIPVLILASRARGAAGRRGRA